MKLTDQPLSVPWAFRVAGLLNRAIPERVRRAARHIPLLNRSIQRFLDQQAPPGATVITVAGGVLRGARLELDLMSEREYWLGSYERQFPLAVRHFCKPGMTIYDVGANIGYTSLMFARIVGVQGCVYAFEPLPANIARLRTHMRLNLDLAHVQVIPSAVSDQEGHEIFLTHQSAAMGKLIGSSDRETTYVDQIEVASLRLDDFVYRDHHPLPDLIKIDIEGGAVKALPGMSRILAERRPLLFMELHGPAEQEVAWDMLQPLGYQLRSMNRGYPVVATRSDLATRWRQHVVAIPCDSV